MGNSALVNVLLFAAIPALAVVGGGLLASFRAPGEKVRSAVQHIAAGVLFAALATELLPDVIHRRMPLVTLAGFALGVVAMLSLKAWTKRLEGKQSDAKNSLPPASYSHQRWISRWTGCSSASASPPVPGREFF